MKRNNTNEKLMIKAWDTCFFQLIFQSVLTLWWLSRCFHYSTCFICFFIKLTFHNDIRQLLYKVAAKIWSKMEVIFIPSVFLISFAFCSVCAFTCIIHPNKWITRWNFLFHLRSLRWCLLDMNDICIIIHSHKRQPKTFWKVQCAHIYWIDHS